MAKRASCQGEATSRDTLRWTDEMDTTFIDALIEECRKGNRVNGTFTTMAYDNILSLLRSIYGNHLRKENLKNRLKTLKDHFGVCYDHFHGLSGFSWNSITKIFEAEVEVWEELIKEWNDEPITPHATNFTMDHSPEIGLSNQSTGSQGTSSRGTKRKTTMSDKLESEMERMSQVIQALIEMMKDGNYFYERSINIAEKQVLTAEEQVQVAKEQVQIAKQQVQIAERGLVILEQSRPRIYSENDVWTELENLADIRLATLYELMKEAGAL
ncbi:uncharacterized protein DS421_15g517110 [Arachis hypogaea]|nr:uncharacterized protein DS421_15g517110 [Arachis hypogaea]